MYCSGDSYPASYKNLPIYTLSVQKYISLVLKKFEEKSLHSSRKGGGREREKEDRGERERETGRDR